MQKSNKTILMIPGLFMDTYSTIEKNFIESSKFLSTKYNIIWLVPSMKNKHYPYKKTTDQGKLLEPIYLSEAKKKFTPSLEVQDISKYNFVKAFFQYVSIFKKHNVDAIFIQFSYETKFLPIIAKIIGKTVIYHNRSFLKESINKKLLKLIH